MGLKETLALTPALSPRRGVKHAQFPGFSRPLVWNCFMGTHVGCYECYPENRFSREVVTQRAGGFMEKEEASTTAVVSRCAL